jgi:type IX secretion system PorP/SprF family membrane protein
MRLLFVLFSLSFIYSNSFAQSLIYNQYLFDPFLLNPSYITQSGYSELNVLYRIQWAGIEDAPRTSGLNFQYAASPRVSLGISLINQDIVLLTSTSALATFGYKVPISRNHYLSFGLSAGVLSNRINLDEVDDISDPALSNFSNTINIDGQSGVSYNFKNLSVGFSLVNLFENNTIMSEEENKIKFNQLRNKIFLLSYQFHINPDFVFQPALQYRLTENYNFFEGTGILTYKNQISLGGFYRQDYGTGLILRIGLNKKIDVGYGYEFAKNQSENYLGGSHEFQMKMRVGQKTPELLTKNDSQEDKIEEQTTDKDLSEEIIVTEAVVAKEELPTLKEEPKNIITAPLLIEPETKVVTNPTAEIKNDETVAKYLLVVGSFRRESNAQEFIRSMRKKGQNAELMGSSTDKLYHVILPEYSRDEVSIEVINEIRQKININDAWFMKPNN